MDQIDKAGRNAWFAWSGGAKPGDPHYYRVQTAAFLIEFDMTQDNANHIHSVWRDFTSDWGGDLLKAHYDASHPNERAERKRRPCGTRSWLGRGWRCWPWTSPTTMRGLGATRAFRVNQPMKHGARS